MATLSVSRPTNRHSWVSWGVLLLITGAELATAMASPPQLGLGLHALVLIGLTVYAALATDQNMRKLCMALILAPLIRLLSISLPLQRVPQLDWYPLVSIPLLITLVVIAYQGGVSRKQMGLRIGQPVFQLLFTSTGVILGVAEYLILRPRGLVSTPSFRTLWMPMLNLAIFTGFTEEVIFRGLLQSVALTVLGRWALIYVSLLFAVLHIGYLSVLDVVFVFCVGMYFAHVVRWGGSILGTTLAHGLTNIMLFLVMPYLSQFSWGEVFLYLLSAVAAASVLTVISIMGMRGMINLRLRPAEDQGQTSSGVVVRRLRVQRRMTRAELAYRAGIPIRQLAAIEAGSSPIDAALVQQLAPALSVSQHTLVHALGNVQSDGAPPVDAMQERFWSRFVPATPAADRSFSAGADAGVIGAVEPASGQSEVVEPASDVPFHPGDGNEAAANALEAPWEAALGGPIFSIAAAEHVDQILGLDSRQVEVPAVDPPSVLSEDAAVLGLPGKEPAVAEFASPEQSGAVDRAVTELEQIDAPIAVPTSSEPVEASSAVDLAAPPLSAWDRFGSMTGEAAQRAKQAGTVGGRGRRPATPGTRQPRRTEPLPERLAATPLKAAPGGRVPLSLVSPSEQTAKGAGSLRNSRGQRATAGKQLAVDGDRQSVGLAHAHADLDETLPLPPLPGEPHQTTPLPHVLGSIAGNEAADDRDPASGFHPRWPASTEFTRDVDHARVTTMLPPNDMIGGPSIDDDEPLAVVQGVVSHLARRQLPQTSQLGGARAETEPLVGLRALRVSHRYTLKDLAGRCGLSERHLYDIEHGKRAADSGTIIRLAQQLGVSIQEVTARLSESLQKRELP